MRKNDITLLHDMWDNCTRKQDIQLRGFQSLCKKIEKKFIKQGYSKENVAHYLKDLVTTVVVKKSLMH